MKIVIDMEDGSEPIVLDYVSAYWMTGLRAEKGIAAEQFTRSNPQNGYALVGRLAGGALETALEMLWKSGRAYAHPIVPDGDDGNVDPG